MSSPASPHNPGYDIASRSESASPPSPGDIEMEGTANDNDIFDSNVEEKDDAMGDLFGNEGDMKDHGPASPSHSATPASERLLTPEAEHRRAMEYSEGDEPANMVHTIQEADVPIPNIPLPHSSDGTKWVVRMPNYVTVDSSPFHPDSYVGPEGDEALRAESLRERGSIINLKVQNTVRWRWVKDGKGVEYKQSNARVIRWSDGSLSLQLGKEFFDISETIDSSGGPQRQSSSTNSQSQPIPASGNTNGKPQGLTYLVAQHQRAQILQSETLVTGFMSLRPTGMQSETHRLLVRAVGQKHNKVARLRMAPDPEIDPEREVQELIKQNAKKSKKRTFMGDDEFGSARRRRSGGSGSRKRTSVHDYWSDEEEESGVYGSDEEDTALGGTRDRNKREVAGERKGGEYQEDDFLVADSSDEELGDAGSDSGKRRGAKYQEEIEEDPLDKLDAKIDQQEEEMRRKKKGGQEPSGDHGASESGVEDVESEGEDEDEAKVRVRKNITGARRKRAAESEDDE